MPSQPYPWYELVSGDTLEQGDILEGCPVFSPPEDLAGEDYKTSMFIWNDVDVVILSQTCDLVKGREKVSEILLCPLFRRSEHNEGYLATPKGMEEARRGNVPGFHILAACSLPGWDREIRIVDLKQVFALPWNLPADKPPLPINVCVCYRLTASISPKHLLDSLCESDCRPTSRRSSDPLFGDSP